MRAVPNEVYLRTRNALATLVSERAATRVLDAALRHASVSADSLDEGGVRTLLLGPVQRELEGILPRTGLRRTLRRLARQVADGAPSRPAHPTPVTTGGPTASGAPTALHPVRRSSVYLPDVPIPDDLPEPGSPRARSEPRRAEDPADHDPDAADWGLADTDPAPALAAVAHGGHGPDGGAAYGGAAGEHAADGRPAAASGARRRGAVSPQAPTPTVVPAALPPEALDRLTVRFAEIEGVSQVIGLRDRNEPPQVRGEGLDPEALAPLARSAIRLLGRHGPLRSLVLEHADGLLFIFPLGRDSVAVLARTDVNMGAVFAARAALEEGQ